ncbi:MAG: glycosyltransferase family 2 protein [Clostridiaceae bacterium]
MRKVEVSVVMAAYNCESYVRKAIESVMIQEPPLELIVVEDCSTDNTYELLMELLEEINLPEGKEFKLLRNEKNSGVAASRNRGVRAAAGRYIAFLDSDDWWEEGKLSKQLSLMKRKAAVLCSTGRELMKPDGSSTGKIIPVKEELSYKELLKHNSINCSSVVLAREVALEFPMGHDNLHEDYITWLSILKKYKKAVAINEPLLKYRLSEGGKSRNKLKSARMTYGVYRYMGYGIPSSILMFSSYVFHGIKKYI